LKFNDERNNCSQSCSNRYFILNILLALIYLIPILLIRRFHNVNNFFTVNLCFATIFACIYWLFVYIVLEFNAQLLTSNGICTASDYFEMMCTFQVKFVQLFIIQNHFVKRNDGRLYVSIPRISFNNPVSIFKYFENRITTSF
jgi:hypothetical protein